MKLATFLTGAEQRVGVVDPERDLIRDVTPRLPAGTDLLALISEWQDMEPALSDETGGIPIDSVNLLAPIPVPHRDIFCVGKNYRDHAVEFGRSGYDTPSRSEDLPEAPIIFGKATTAVTGPSAPIETHPSVTKELDYEGELAVIIGRGGRGITRDRAYEHVWGYTIINDVTARDLQRKHKQWLLGKSLDTHCPMGPYAVTADEIADVADLRVETTVNGEPRQSAQVKDLIFDIPELIATISAGITLLPGDLIATGTPSGVGIGYDPPRFLAAGDVVEVTITGIGTLSNRIG